MASSFINVFSGKLIRHKVPSASALITCATDRFVTAKDQAVFVLSNTPKTGSIHFYRSGQFLDEGGSLDYTISGMTITLNADVASSIKAGENVAVKYIVA